MSLFKGETNPFLHDTVVRRLFEFLSFKEIKNCRLVCTKWNFVSEPFLRKGGKVVFLATFRPGSFIKYIQSHLPAVPFTSFKFAKFDKLTHPNSNWTVSEIHRFLAKYGANIKILEFDKLTMFENELHGGRIDMLRTQMNEFIDLAPNIVDLKIACSFLTTCVVSLSKLVSVKKLHLENCTVDQTAKEERITPLKIYLQKMKFQIDGVELNQVSLHDFVDFSQCTEIECHHSPVRVTLDMLRLVNVRKLYLESFQFVNWSTSRAKIDHLILCNYNIEEGNETEMEIKKLTLDNSQYLSLLPTTIEELKITDGAVYSSEEIDLPNLKYLKLYSNFYFPRELKTISLFKTCSKLTDVFIGFSPSSYYKNEICLLNISWLPPTIKKLKFIGFNNFIFAFDAVINVDVLDLDVKEVSDAQNFFNYVRPKVLVCSEIRKVHSNDFINFVLKNKQIEKIFISFYNRGNVGDDPEFETSVFFSYVDQYALLYEFENGQGKAIREEQFQNVRDWS